jgi:hypothetical protein
VRRATWARTIKPGLISLDDLPRDPGRGFRPLHVPGQPMSRRFPAFSRLFWQSLRPQPGLHPAMRARMWKPGQSGNPAGVSKAYAEAMREMSLRARELSFGAARTRRWRQRRQHGLVVVSFDGRRAGGHEPAPSWRFRHPSRAHVAAACLSCFSIDQRNCVVSE